MWFHETGSRMRRRHGADKSLHIVTTSAKNDTKPHRSCDDVVVSTRHCNSDIPTRGRRSPDGMPSILLAGELGRLLAFGCVDSSFAWAVSSAADEVGLTVPSPISVNPNVSSTTARNGTS